MVVSNQSNFVEMNLFVGREVGVAQLWLVVRGQGRQTLQTTDKSSRAAEQQPTQPSTRAEQEQNRTAADEPKLCVFYTYCTTTTVLATVGRQVTNITTSCNYYHS